MLKRVFTVFLIASIVLISGTSLVVVPVRADYVYKFIDLDKFGRGYMPSWDQGRCGQAAVASIINYFLGYRAITDQTVAQYTGSPWYGLDNSQIQGAVNHFAQVYGLRGNTWITGYDTNTMVSQIDLQHPLIVTEATWGGGHATVIIGYRFDPNTGTYTPYSYDLGFSNGWIHNIIVTDYSVGGAGGAW
jgi:hypothetical protein